MSRSRGQCSTGVGLSCRGEAVVLLAAGLGSLAGDGEKAGVAGAVGNGGTIITAPPTISQITEINLAPCAVWQVALHGIPRTILGECGLRVLVKSHGLGFVRIESELHEGIKAHSRLRSAIFARFVPHNDRNLVSRRVREGVAVLVILDVIRRIEQYHVTAIWIADIANIFVIIAIILGVGDTTKALGARGGRFGRGLRGTFGRAAGLRVMMVLWVTLMNTTSRNDCL